jgi:hypothetical protein
MKIGRLSRFAETNFASLCAAADVRCNESQEDENGWDHMVEFPPDPHGGHPDTQPPFKKAFVQIKSSRARRLSCSIKLSNALKAAQSRDPWFVVLTVETAVGLEVYAIHVWKGLIEKTLKAVRHASIEGRELNRSRLTIGFSDSDRKTDNLLAWMKAQIDEVTPEYGAAKNAIYASVGYSDGYGSGEITFAATSIDQFLDELLGIGSGLPISKFNFTPSRFGLADRQPEVDVQGGRIEIKPTTSLDCELRLRGPLPGSSISLPAQLFTAGLPGLPIEQRRFRLATAGFDFVWTNGGESKFNIELNYESRVNIDQIYRHALMMVWLEKGAVDVQIWVKGTRVAGGTIRPEAQNWEYDWQKVLDVLETLKSLLPNGAPTFELSVADLNRGAASLYSMHEMVSSPSIRFEFFPLSDHVYDFTKMVYYSIAEAGDLVAFAIVEREVRNRGSDEAGRLRLDFDRPVIRESWVVRAATNTHEKMASDDYVKHVAALEKDTKVLVLNNIADFILSMHEPQQELVTKGPTDRPGS